MKAPRPARLPGFFPDESDKVVSIKSKIMDITLLLIAVTAYDSRDEPLTKYLNNLIEQDHRNVKSRVTVMLGFKRFRNAAGAISGIELMHRIRKGQFDLTNLCLKKPLHLLSG